MKEPILWFLLSGAMLFGADHYFFAESETVVVDDAVRDRVSSLWQSQMGRSLTPEQLDSLVENWVKEEVLFREALRLNLDKGDQIVRRRLVQKLQFLMEGSDVSQPTGQDLEAFYEHNIARYSEPRRFSFSQVYFLELARAESWASAIIDSDNSDDSDDSDVRGDPTMLNGYYVSRSKPEISKIFGRSFVAAVDSFVLDEWSGPFKSSFGYHFVRLEKVDDPIALPLGSIEMKVLADYREEQRDAMLNDYYESLRERTRIVYR